MAERMHLSIGEVLTLLQPEFPDVTISKIRFLESQGLLDPERTPSGYRKFHDDDIDRLRWILTQQRDHFLPLKVIKDRLSSGDLQGGGDGVLALATDGAADDAADTPSAVVDTESAAAPDESAAPLAPPLQAVIGDEPAEADGGPRAEGGAESGPEPEAEPDISPAPAGGATAAGTEPDSDVDAGGTTGGDVAASTGRASLTLLRRAGVVAADEPDPEIVPRTDGDGDGDDHERGEAVARLVEAPADARPEPAAARSRGRRRHPTGRGAGGPVPPPEPPAADRPEPLEPAQTVSLSLEELSAATGLSPRDIGELERYGLIANRAMGTVRYYDDEALVVARLAAGFGRYGIEARHLRMYKVSAEREAGLFEQLITPLLKQRRASAREEAVATLEDLAELADDLRAAMVRSALRDYLGRQ